MKLKSFLIPLLLALSLTAFAQQPQKKVAVYVTGDDAGINKILASKLSYAIGRDDKFSVIERADDFLAAIAKEQSYQRTGAVADEEISRIGKQFGVQLVCVTTINKAFDIPYISARLIDVETAEIEGAASCSNMLTSGKDVMNIGDTLANRLLKSMSSDKALAWKKIAVYITPSDAGKDISNILGDVLVAGFSKNGRYVAVERTNTFLSQLSAEQDYQRNGAVNDRDISLLGKQMGVNYVCVADVSEVLGEKYISARLIDVETAEIINMSETTGKMDNINTCIDIANQIVQTLSKGTYEEQFYEDASFIGYFSYSLALKDGSLSKFNIPDWFMNMSENTYVGISMPGGDELDAIGMAVIQKILASDKFFSYNSKYEENKTDMGRKKGEYMEIIASTHLSIDMVIHYQIQELEKLPNGEYVCRLADGNRNRLHIKMEYGYFSKDEKLPPDASSFNDMELQLEYADRKYNFLIKSSCMGNRTLYKSYCEKDFNTHTYRFINQVSQQTDMETKDINMPYIFPVSRVSGKHELKQHTFTFDPEKCLAEQLLDYYMRIMVESLPRNYSMYGIKRSKTPIICQQYDNGQFIISTTK